MKVKKEGKGKGKTTGKPQMKRETITYWAQESQNTSNCFLVSFTILAICSCTINHISFAWYGKAHCGILP